MVALWSAALCELSRAVNLESGFSFVMIAFAYAYVYVSVFVVRSNQSHAANRNRLL